MSATPVLAEVVSSSGSRGQWVGVVKPANIFFVVWAVDLDRSEATEPMRVSVVDQSGNVLWKQDVGLGFGEDVVLNVSNVLRLTLMVEPIESNPGWRTVGFGDAAVIGTPPAGFLGE